MYRDYNMSLSFKLSPIMIFLILLIVLVISVVFSKSNWSIPEGFISYNYSGETPSASLQQLVIPPYNKTAQVYHVYDSIYFDSNNGNVIEFFGKQYDPANNNQTNVLTDMFIITRSEPTVKDYKLISDVDTVNNDAYLNDVSSLNSDSWVFPDSLVGNLFGSFQYQILYIPWGKDTVLFIYDSTVSKKMVSSTLFSNKTPSPISNMNPNILRISNTTYKGEFDPRNDSYVMEVLYDPLKTSNVFQISSNVLFDTKSGYLIIRHGGKIDVYNGVLNTTDGSPIALYSNIDKEKMIKDTPTTITNANLNSFVLNDVDGNNVVIYIPMLSNKVMVVVLTVDPNSPNLFAFVNVVRFDSSVANGVDGKTIPSISTTASLPPASQSTSSQSTSSQSTSSQSTSSTPNLSLNDVISNYYQQYYGSKNGGGSNVPGAYSNDFLLKTQIIPPVCPSCPSCPSNVSCTNCGGNGGAGMVGTFKNTYYDIFGNKIVYDASKNPILVDSNGNQIIQIFDNSGNQVQFVHGKFIPIPPTSSDRIISSSTPTSSSNTNFGGTVSSLGSSASNLGGNIISGAGNIVVGAENVVGNAIGTAGGIVNNAISTVGKLGQGNGQYSSDSYGSGSMNDNNMYQNSRGQAGNYYGDSNGISNIQSSIAPKGNYITSGASPSTYYGALPERGSTNFMPVTSDFSKFGR